MDCNDMMNALLTVSKLPDSVVKLNIHLGNSFPIVFARNFLITHIMLSPNFDPSSCEDMDYLWSIWYSYRWDERVFKRFFKEWAYINISRLKLDFYLYLMWYFIAGYWIQISKALALKFQVKVAMINWKKCPNLGWTLPTAGWNCFVTSTSLKGTIHLKFKCFPFL